MSSEISSSEFHLAQQVPVLSAHIRFNLCSLTISWNVFLEISNSLSQPQGQILNKGIHATCRGISIIRHGCVSWSVFKVTLSVLDLPVVTWPASPESAALVWQTDCLSLAWPVLTVFQTVA